MSFAKVAWKFTNEAERLLKAWNRKKSRTLRRVGAYGRTVMKRGFRSASATQSSRPGEIPRSHPPHNLRNLTLYGYDAFADAVVIGPKKITPKVKQTGQPVPGLLAQGGTVRRRLSLRRGVVNQTARYQPRPYTARAYGPVQEFLLNVLATTPLL